jgi:hypothetical protein
VSLGSSLSFGLSRGIAQVIGKPADNSSGFDRGVDVAETAPKGSGLSWYVRRGANVRGPFSSAKVRHYVLEGRLQLEDEVSRDRSEWRRLGAVQEVVPPTLRDDGAPAQERQEQDRRREKLRALRAMVVVMVVVAGLVAVVLLGSQGVDEPLRDCAAPAAPSVVWEGCRLSGADLSGATLTGARLANTLLSGALLGEADLSGADLRYADLSGSDLSYANLRGASLMGANLRQADLTNADFRNADLSFADFSQASIGGAVFDDAIMQSVIAVDGKRCATRDCPR